MDDIKFIDKWVSKYGYKTTSKIASLAILDTEEEGLCS